MSVSTRFHLTCGIRQDGSLWCWGGNNLSQFGVDIETVKSKCGDLDCYAVPVLVSRGLSP